MYTLFWLSLINLVTPGADIRTQEQKHLTQAECTMRRDGMLITWSGSFVAWCQKE
jgi:hypothetical protein